MKEPNLVEMIKEMRNMAYQSANAAGITCVETLRLDQIHDLAQSAIPLTWGVKNRSGYKYGIEHGGKDGLPGTVLFFPEQRQTAKELLPRLLDDVRTLIAAQGGQGKTHWLHQRLKSMEEDIKETLGHEKGKAT